MYSFSISKRSDEACEKIPQKEYSLALSCVIVIIGLVGLGFGGQWVVDGAVTIANRLGVSNAFIGLTIVASLKAVGVVLVLSLLITPAATAYLLVNRLHLVMLLGVLIGVTSSIAGMYLSYFYNLPSGPAIVLVASGIFVLSFLFSPSQGLLTNPSSNWQQSSVIKELKNLLNNRQM